VAKISRSIRFVWFNANLEKFVGDFGKIVENSDSEKFGCN